VFLLIGFSFFFDGCEFFKQTFNLFEKEKLNDNYIWCDSLIIFLYFCKKFDKWNGNVATNNITGGCLVGITLNEKANTFAIIQLRRNKNRHK